MHLVMALPSRPAQAAVVKVSLKGDDDESGEETDLDNAVAGTQGQTAHWELLKPTKMNVPVADRQPDLMIAELFGGKYTVKNALSLIRVFIRTMETLPHNFDEVAGNSICTMLRGT